MISRVKILHRRLLQVTSSPGATHLVPLSAIQRVTHVDQSLRIYAASMPIVCTYDKSNISWRDFQTIVQAFTDAAAVNGQKFTPFNIDEPVRLELEFAKYKPAGTTTTLFEGHTNDVHKDEDIEEVPFKAFG